MLPLIGCEFPKLCLLLSEGFRVMALKTIMAIAALLALVPEARAERFELLVPPECQSRQPLR